MATTPSTIESTAKQDLTKVEASVKSYIDTAESDVNADLAKTYAGKVVAVAFLIGAVLGFIARCIL